MEIVFFGLNFIERIKSKDRFFHCTIPLFHSCYAIEHIFTLLMAIAVRMHFIRVMLGHVEEHPSCTYVCRLDGGSGNRRIWIR